MVKNVTVALRKNSPSTKKAEAEGLKVLGIEEAAKWCDLMMFTMPDELQAETYKNLIHNNLKSGAAIAFAHGLNVHFGLIEPKQDVDVIMMAPKGSYSKRVCQRWRCTLFSSCTSKCIRKSIRNRLIILLCYRWRKIRHYRN